MSSAEAKVVAVEPAGESRRKLGNPAVGMFAAMWRRDMLRLRKEPSRWFGVVLQPLMFWAIIGSGMSETFTLEGAEGTSYLEFFYPGVLTMVILFTTIFGTITVIEDRQSGFLQGVMASPAGRFSMVAGKVAGVTSLASIQSVVFLLLAPVAGYPVNEVNWAAVVAVVLLSSIGLTAMSLMGAWVMRTSQAYHAVMSLVLLPLWIVSGAMFPGHGPVLSGIMLVNPMRYSVDGLRVALGSSASGAAEAVSLSTSLAVLGGFSLVMLWCATRVCSSPGRS